MQLILLAALPLLASAVPFQDSQTTSIPLTRRSAATLNGIAQPQVLLSQLAQTQAKFTRAFNAFESNMGFPHSLATAKSGLNGRATLDLTDQQEVLWFGSIEVGTPPVTFTVDFDTGSSDLFLPASDCTLNCAGHKLWTTSASSTAKSLKANYSLEFGDGSTVEGIKFTDTVTIAGLKATTQTVGASTQYSTGFDIASFQPDGLMGMGFPQISVFNASPVFNTLIAQKQTQPLFTFNLADNGSELVLGGFDPATVLGDFTFTPVIQVGFWQVIMDAISTNGKPAVTGATAIIDTGTTLIIGDTGSVAAFYQNIPGAQDASATLGGGLFTLPCANFPDVTLTFGGKAFPVSAAAFNLGQVSANSTDCVGGLAAANLGAFFVVGDVFLRNVVAQFDVGQMQVGFALPSNPGTTNVGVADEATVSLTSSSSQTRVRTGIQAVFASILLAAMLL